MTYSVYVSPHLDDAALSCGGRIMAQVARGETVRIINVFAGIPNIPEQEFSPYAQKQHKQWRLSPKEAVIARRNEDHRVLSSLGVEITNWDYYDAIYRRSELTFLYVDHRTVFGPIHPDEQSLIECLTEQLAKVQYAHPDAIFFAPLRIGGHVDHLIARECAVRLYRQGSSVIFYEDFPYVAREHWKDEPNTVEKALRELPFGTRNELISIDAEAKIAALLGYESQIETLFGDKDGRGLARDVYTYSAKIEHSSDTKRTGHFEQYWHPC